MIRMLVCCGLLVLCASGCANRRAWGLPGGQGTVERQKARATIHDPFPLNDIGPDVVGGRPREFFNPKSEAVRNEKLPRLQTGFGY